MRLVLAVEREEHVLVRAAGGERQQLTADRDLARRDAELETLAQRRHAHLGAAPEQDAGGVRRLVGEHGDGAGLDDPGLLRGDRGDVVPEEALVVERDRQDDGHLRVQHVGRVPRAPHADLDGGHLDGRVREGGVRHRHEHLEERHPGFAGRHPPLVDEVDVGRDVLVGGDEPLGRQRPAVDRDPLPDVDEVRAGEAAGPQAVLAQEPLHQPRRGRLAVRARQVDGPEGLLRVSEQTADLADPVQRRDEVVLGGAVEDRLLDLGQAGPHALR